MEPLDPALVAIHRSALFQHERANDDTRAESGSFPEPLNRLPNWIQILRRAMSTLASTEKGKWPELPFGDVLVGFIATGQELLGIRCAKSMDGLGAQAVASLQRALGESVAEVLAPCLLSEFASERPAGAGILGIFAAELAPSIGTERYQQFVERHRADGLRQILTKFPVAGRLAGMRIDTWVEATSEMLDRLARDLAEIRADLLQSTEDAFVADIAARLSDPHCRGRSVAILTFSDGHKLVYKPRSLAPEAAWRTLVSAPDIGHAQLSARVMDRGAYGWMEHVAARDVEAENDVRAFYRSAGSLLCLARAFSLKDLHFENIIAAGDHPVVIDLETLAQPSPRSVPTSTLDHIAATREELLANSVQATEALPVRYTVSDRPPLDISAFADMGAAIRRRAVWSGLGSDAIALLFEEESIPATNLPRRQGVVQRSDAFLEDILAGFEETWLALAKARPSLMRTGGIVEGISAMPVRFIFRPTEIYYRILARALAPENLRSGGDYSRAFEALNVAAGPDAPPGFRRIATAEIEALHRGDIPRFTVTVSGNTVFEDGACVAEDLLAMSGLETIQQRMSSLTAEQLDVERRIIRATFGAARWSTVAAPAAKLDLAASPLAGDEAVEAALGIGRAIAGAAQLRSDGGYTWIGVAYDPRSAGPAALALKEGLYEGTTGVGVFLAALFQVTGEQSWAALAERALTDARRIARETPAEERVATVAHLGRGLGGFDGLVYGLTLAAGFLGSEAVRDDARRLASWLETDTTATHAEPDLLGGDIGALPGLLALAVAIEAHAAIGRYCDDHPRSELKSSGRGFGHGPTGAAATLALVAKNALDAERLLAMAERSVDIPQDGALPDGPVGWCKGPIGQALARLALNARLSRADPADIAELERVIGQAIAAPHALDQLCCGLFGGVEAFLVAARHGRTDLSEAAGILARALMVRADASGGFRLLAGLPAGVGSVGLFQGMSGIGYTLLRLARPQSFPSILMTEWQT